MPTEFNPLPGLHRTACTLDLDPALLLYLITVIGRRWAHHHPHAPTGRPQSDFVD